MPDLANKSRGCPVKYEFQVNNKSADFARRSNQSILKEISPEYSLKGLMLNRRLQYFDAKNRFIGKDPDAGED